MDKEKKVQGEKEEKQEVKKEEKTEKNEKIVFEAPYDNTDTDGYQHKSLHIQITKRDDNTINEITAKLKIV